MGQKESSNHDRKDKHLNSEECIQIETLHREGYTAKDIGERFGRSRRTIAMELERGWVTRRTRQYCVEERYSAGGADDL
jgi:IS30 family transposase